MKILSYEECKNELSKIQTNNPNNITIDSKDIKTIIGDAIFTVEELDSESESNDIVLDVEDIDTITKGKDLLVMSVFECNGSNAAEQAIQSAVLDLEENKLSLAEADGILVSFRMNTNYPIMELAGAMEIIHDKLSEIYTYEEPNSIWGISCHDDMKEDSVKATVFISYSKQRRGTYTNNYITKPLS